MAALVVVPIVYGCYATVYYPGFAIGDWLINYTQGFIRRGLPGELLLLTSRGFHLPLLWLTLAVQAAIYLAFLYGVARLASPLKRNALWVCMMYSPGALCFMLLCPLNGYRKETLLLAAVTAMVFLMRRKISASALLASLTGLMVVLVLSHESLVVCFPYFFAVVAVGSRDLKFAAKITALPYLIAAVLVVFVRHHPGDVGMAAGICRSVGGTWQGLGDPRGLCTGSIAWLTVTLEQYHAQELDYLHYWPMYLGVAALSFAPFVVALRVLYREEAVRFEVKVVSATAALVALASGTLFYATIDWGRWIYMQVVCLLVMVLMVAQRAKSLRSDGSPETAKPRGPRRWAVMAAVFLYCTTWTVPTVASMPVRFGYLDAALYMYRDIKLQKRIKASDGTWR